LKDLSDAINRLSKAREEDQDTLSSLKNELNTKSLELEESIKAINAEYAANLGEVQKKVGDLSNSFRNVLVHTEMIMNASSPSEDDEPQQEFKRKKNKFKKG